MLADQLGRCRWSGQPDDGETMARIARIAVPGVPHLVMQRGACDQPAFAIDQDYVLYRSLVADAAAAARTAVWAYCLMPDHVALVVVPSAPDGLRRTLADAHRRYAKMFNARHGRSGPLWRGRFRSVTVDDPYVAVAVRYICFSPVRERLVAQVRDWPWSSVSAHLAGRDDPLVTARPVLERLPDFATAVERDVPAAAAMALRRAVSTGRPLGDATFLNALERRLGIPLRPRKRGPKPRSQC